MFEGFAFHEFVERVWHSQGRKGRCLSVRRCESQSAATVSFEVKLRIQKEPPQSLTEKKKENSPINHKLQHEPK